MIVYNVTVNVDLDIHDEWLKWMKDVHILEVMQTGLFFENRMFKVMVDEEAGVTYSIQYSCNNMNDYNTYQQQHAPALQQKHKQKYGEKFVAFRTLLQKV